VSERHYSEDMTIGCPMCGPLRVGWAMETVALTFWIVVGFVVLFTVEWVSLQSLLTWTSPAEVLNDDPKMGAVVGWPLAILTGVLIYHYVVNEEQWRVQCRVYHHLRYHARWHPDDIEALMNPGPFSDVYPWEKFVRREERRHR
jgi:hypothetical protein